MPRRAAFSPLRFTTPEPPDDDEFETPDGVHEFKVHERRLFRKLGTSFFLFGLINNVLYVIILSAALDLVPPSTPKGIILFCNIAPSLSAKVAWPYILKGRIRYAKRLSGCCLLSTLGMIVVALFDSLRMRLLGICLASFSSGLGELTFLQLSTTYAPSSVAGYSVGYFASGTGAAGLVGAFLWWVVRGLGVTIGVGISCILPSVIPLTYFFLLPNASAFLDPTAPATYEEFLSPPPPLSALPYTPLAAEADDLGEEEGRLSPGPKRGIALSANDKWRLVKPLLRRYMLPLFCVYLFEYTINQGIGPTLLYPVPSPYKHWLLSRIIHSVRDYYPLWQLVYQSNVFLSRSSISLGMSPLPRRLLPLPSIIQFFILSLLTLESAKGILGPGDGSHGDDRTNALSIWLVFALVSLEGICGGLAYVNAFYHVNHEPPETPSVNSRMNDLEWMRQEREFKIGSIGFADSMGILLASLVAMPMELELCRTQVERGKLLCRGL
jgi:battenin